MLSLLGFLLLCLAQKHNVNLTSVMLMSPFFVQMFIDKAKLLD